MRRFLNNLLKTGDLSEIKKMISEKLNQLSLNNQNEINDYDSFPEGISNEFLIEELTQINETHTLERTRYYIKRLIKSFDEVKTAPYNDINLNLWKQYDDVLTDSLWVLKKRDSSGAHNSSYWGNFIPQIPNQFITRYTKRGEWVLDTFLGSGTTLIECMRLNRNGIGIDLHPDAVKLAKENISKENPISDKEVQLEIINGNSAEVDYQTIFNNLKINKVQLIIMHPPYWDIIKFSDNKNDLSNASDKKSFLKNMEEIVKRTYDVLEDKRFLVVVIGDKYAEGEWIPLGFEVMQMISTNGYKLKSIVVKNFDETKGKRNQKELWRYRALAGGFFVFKHEYIFLFQKTKKRGENGPANN